MISFMGLFLSDTPRALQGLSDAPYTLMGPHALCSRHTASQEGVMAAISGSLHNARALSKELESLGVLLPSGSPSASLVLAAYQVWGAEYPRHLEGTIATALIDTQRRILVLSRDRMGETPLFYAQNEQGIAFSTHPSPLLEAPGVSRVVDAQGLRELIGLGPARTPGQTPFKDIFSLQRGHVLVARDRGATISPYWSLAAQEHTDSKAQTIGKVRDLLKNAVSRVAGSRPASMLSGGLDSTLLTALCGQASGRMMDTFSVDYEENHTYFKEGAYQPEEDGPWIEKAVSALGTHHIRVELPIQAVLVHLRKAMQARGFPGMADIDSSLLLLCREIAHTHRSVLSGECADEVFGGYPWFHREDLIDLDGFPWSGSLELRARILTPEVRSELSLAGYVQDSYRQICAAQPLLPGEDAQNARLRMVQGLCFDTFMANLQERAHTMAAHYGLRMLTPFCDHELVQYVYNVPWQMKNMFGREKGLLRAAAQGILPDELIWRRKSPYPKTYHPQYTRGVVQAIELMLHDEASPLLQIVDKEVLRELIRGDLAPNALPWYGQLMAGPQMLAYLLQINQWMLEMRVQIRI